MQNLISKLKLNWSNFTKNDSAIALSIAPAYAYENGKRTDNIEGYNLEIVLPELGFEKMRVKVLQRPKFSQTDIETASCPFTVKFEDFSARLYIIDGVGRISAKAQKCVVHKTDLYADYTAKNL